MPNGNRIALDYDREAFQRSDVALRGDEASFKGVRPGFSPSPSAKQIARDLETTQRQPGDAVASGLILSVRPWEVVGGTANNITLAQ
jgi:hypothetical protein